MILKKLPPEVNTKKRLFSGQIDLSLQRILTRGLPSGSGIQYCKEYGTIVILEF